ncbi:EF-hand calcium-binding domain-containing protein 12-like isoform X2 [Hemiscyllium ocellatum]|uniref:EF-hand calcium-binding domain-containing protein 12-like isoform X2 n=1 Tax=Hemiscyllium ocellatum TaxID=170820 RepID=UPI002966B788|nr:EF-hand calcium-binding domain-containing protein 12-like isoform X2 [Hemiscyllium ocellatum]
MDLMEQCLLVRGEKRTIACHSLPTTIAGEMGKANNVHRQRCLEEYKKILKMCQYYGISFTERMLEKALLHPGDKLKMEPGLKLRPPGTGLLPKHEVEKWVSTRQLIALEQLNRQLAEKKGEIQRESKLENITLKDVSQETKLKKLKVKAQSVPDLTHNAQANPYAFWPGHLLDKVRMYLPYVTLEHQEVFFSNTHQVARLSPYRYYSNNNWPISEQGYLTYGDIDMRKRYWL